MAVDNGARPLRDPPYQSPSPTDADRRIEELTRIYAELSASMSSCRAPLDDSDVTTASLAEIENARDQYFDHLTLITKQLQALRASSIPAVKCKAVVLKDWYYGEAGTVQDDLVFSLIDDIEALKVA